MTLIKTEYVAQRNERSGTTLRTRPLAGLLRAEPTAVLFDVRDATAYRNGHIEGAAHLSEDRLPGWMKRIPKEAPVFIYCYHGNASKTYAQMFIDFRYTRFYSVNGGYPALEMALSAPRMSSGHFPNWMAAHPLTPSDVDCATAVMLKILDGKCKMGEVEKIVMAVLYDALRDRPCQRFGAREHALIASARRGADEALRNAIYERRVLAETAISRPVMKAFKAMIRAQGLFAGLVEEVVAGD